MANLSDEILLERFVATFEKLDEWIARDHDIPANSQKVAIDGFHSHDYKPKPVKFQTASTALAEFYELVPLRFPPLLEKLLLSYRWPEVDLVSYRLAANPPGEGLNGFFHAISGDQYLWEMLIPAGYLPFGKGPDVDYDPVCFDNSPKSPAKGRVVKIDHEEILCHDRIRIVSELAPNFLDLVLQTLAEAKTL
jgi:hypothetical protein